MVVNHYRRLWLYVLCGLVLLFLTLPVLIVIPTSFSASRLLEFPPTAYSFRWYNNLFASQEWKTSAWISLQVSILTVLVATPLGVAAAYGIHNTTSRFTRWIEVALVAPAIVPAIITAIGVLYLLAKLKLVYTIFGLVVADSVLAIPFVVVPVLAGFRRFDMNQEKVARSLGASRLRAVWTITLPQLSHSIFAGAIFAFITAFDESVVSIFISSGMSSTLTRRMFSKLRDEIDPSIAAISTILIAISVIAMLFVFLRTVVKERRTA